MVGPEGGEEVEVVGDSRGCEGHTDVPGHRRDPGTPVGSHQRGCSSYNSSLEVREVGVGVEETCLGVFVSTVGRSLPVHTPPLLDGRGNRNSNKIPNLVI